LVRELAIGPARVSEVEERAKVAGVSAPTLRRVKDRLRVTVTRVKEGWVWAMPGRV
jgi:hypothetical protein